MLWWTVVQYKQREQKYSQVLDDLSSRLKTVSRCVVYLDESFENTAEKMTFVEVFLQFMLPSAQLPANYKHQH